MHYTRIGKRTVNAVRMAEVLQVLVKHGFADLLRRAGFEDGMPARVLRGLNLIEAPAGPPATFGARMRAALTELGPTFIKFGQVLSTRPDLVGPRTASELTLLLDEVAPLPFEAMEGVFRAEFGVPVEERFSSFDKEPVASASLSQVYRAMLTGGQPVAVKMQRPGIEKKILSDISLMRQLAEWVADHIEETSFLDPVGIVDEFSRSIRRELDFSVEACIIEQFDQALKNTDYVFVPTVHKALSSERVLTMDWIDGVRVDRFDAYEARNCDRSEIAVRACTLMCDMVFKHHIFHADPHPGNVFITHDNQLAFLDLGMAGHLEKSDVAAIADLFLSIFVGDSAGCVDAISELSTERLPENRQALEHELAEFIAFEAHAIISGGQVAKGIERAIEIIRRYHLELAPRFTLLLKALATVERVGRTLDPETDFVTIMQPYLERLILERFRPPYIFREARHNANAFLKLTRRIPGDATFLLHQLRKGKLRFELHHEQLEQLANALDRSSNRNAVSTMTAALIVGSSLLIVTDSPLTRLGIAGFVFAGLLGTALIVSILWTRKF